MIDASLEAYRLLHDLENAPFIKKIHSAKFTGLVKPNDELTLMLDERNGMQWVTLYKEGIQTAEIVFEVSWILQFYDSS